MAELLTPAEREELRALAGIAAKEPEDLMGPLVLRLLAQLEATEAERDVHLVKKVPLRPELRTLCGDRFEGCRYSLDPRYATCAPCLRANHDRAIAAAVEAERDRLRATLVEALEWGDEGWSYASDYYREKWNCARERARIAAALVPADDRETGERP
jgi:hypothetical protein